MSGLYVDTSSLGRVLLGEPDAPGIKRSLTEFDQRYGSRLMRTELLRLGARTGLEHQTGRVLAGISFVPLDDAILRSTARLRPFDLGTLDAIHLASALALDRRGLIETIMTHDRRLAAAARDHGLEVVAPV